MSGCATVRRLVRDDVLRLLTYTAQRLDGTQAQAHGLVTEVSADPLARAQAIADAIAGRSPSAIRACKTLLNTLDDGDAAEILQAESDLQQSVMGGPNPGRGRDGQSGKAGTRFPPIDGKSRALTAGVRPGLRIYLLLLCTMTCMHAAPRPPGRALV